MELLKQKGKSLSSTLPATKTSGTTAEGLSHPRLDEQDRASHDRREVALQGVGGVRVLVSPIAHPASEFTDEFGRFDVWWYVRVHKS